MNSNQTNRPPGATQSNGQIISPSSYAATAAYLTTIAIWTTTPLAIKWSNDSLSPVASITLRIFIATALALIICCTLLKSQMPKRQHFLTYLVASIGIFPNMLLVYFASDYISSGLISVLFAISPFFTGLIAWLVFKQSPFNLRQILAFIIATGGLLMIFSEQLTFNDGAYMGFILMILSNICFATSSVLLKRYGQSVPVFEQTTGSMMIALTGLLITCAVLWATGDYSFVKNANSISLKSAASIAYLASIGSLVGFMCYFFVVQKMSLAATATLPLITPVAALWLGHFANDEAVTHAIMLGSAAIILSLALFDNTLVKAIFQKNRGFNSDNKRIS